MLVTVYKKTLLFSVRIKSSLDKFLHIIYPRFLLRLNKIKRRKRCKCHISRNKYLYYRQGNCFFDQRLTIQLENTSSFALCLLLPSIQKHFLLQGIQLQHHVLLFILSSCLSNALNVEKQNRLLPIRTLLRIKNKPFFNVFWFNLQQSFLVSNTSSSSYIYFLFPLCVCMVGQ